MRTPLLSLTVRWVALLSASLAFALPPGASGDDYIQLTAPQAKEVLHDFRASRLNGDLCFKFEVIHKPGVGHHPHGLDDPTPVVEFIEKHCR